MATGLNPETGLFEQFAGFDLEKIDLAAYEGALSRWTWCSDGSGRNGPRWSSRPMSWRSRLCCQRNFPAKRGAANFRYYEPRCGHGSSLSGAMHGLVAARLGYSELALRYFRQAAAIDLADTHTTIAAGLHMAALGGTWLTAVFGFAGLSLQGDGIGLDPKLPASWRSLEFGVQWRGRRLKVRIDRAEQLLQATLEAGELNGAFRKRQPPRGPPRPGGCVPLVFATLISGSAVLARLIHPTDVR